MWTWRVYLNLHDISRQRRKEAEEARKAYISETVPYKQSTKMPTKRR
jgi:hypothetical protein